MRKYLPHLFVLMVLALATATGLHGVLRDASIDFRFNQFRRDAQAGIVLVEIDAASIERAGAWPWPRQLHADLLGKLAEAGVADIVFDVDFSSAAQPASDAAFADALRTAGGSVVLPLFRQRASDNGPDQSIHVTGPLPIFARHSWPATVTVAAEPDGLVRRYGFGDRLGDQFVPSMGAMLAGKFDETAAPFWIDFSIRARSVPTVSYHLVLAGDCPDRIDR